MSQNFKRVRDLRIDHFLYFEIKLYNVCEVITGTETRAEVLCLQLN